MSNLIDLMVSSRPEMMAGAIKMNKTDEVKTISGTTSTGTSTGPLKRPAEEPESPARGKKRARAATPSPPPLSPIEVHVPRDYEYLNDAIAFANQEFQSAAARSEKDTTITIRIDGPCELESSLVVHAVGDGAQLILASASKDNPVALSLETKVPNQPLLQLCQGSVVLENLSLEHSSSVDLVALITRANNNAAVVVNRPKVFDQHNEPAFRSALTLNKVIVRSYSGKGIINRNLACEVTQNDCIIMNPLF